MTTTRTTQTAYQTAVADAQQQLAALTAYVAGHQECAQGHVTPAHVADMAQLVTALHAVRHTLN